MVVWCSERDHPWPGMEGIEVEAEVRQTADFAELEGLIGDAQVFVDTDLGRRALPRVWDRAAKLRWVHATSAGVDKLLFPELAESDLPITNAAGIFDDGIAEYVVGLMLVFAKDLIATLELQRREEWRHRDNEGLAGTRLVVVGAGRIGRAIATRARALGVDVVGVASRDRPGDDDFRRIVASASLGDELAEADWVAIAAPLTDATRGLFDEATFARMKPGARLINIGRGPIVVTDDLVAALESGRCGGAGLDVFEEEPLPAGHPLWAMPNVVVSPHMAGDIRGWREATSRQFIDFFRRWRAGEELPNRVDTRRGYAPVHGREGR